jgi:hypothetical protein
VPAKQLYRKIEEARAPFRTKPLGQRHTRESFLSFLFKAISESLFNWNLLLWELSKPESAVEINDIPFEI